MQTVINRVKKKLFQETITDPFMATEIQPFPFCPLPNWIGDMVGKKLA